MAANAVESGCPAAVRTGLAGNQVARNNERHAGRCHVCPFSPHVGRIRDLNRVWMPYASAEVCATMFGRN